MPQLDSSALFHSLAGTWHLKRNLVSSNTSDLQGRCTGTATYSVRQPSVFVDEEGQLQLAVAEMLYHERGDFDMSSVTDSGSSKVLKVPFERKYIWRLSRSGGKSEMNIWFTKPGTEEIDYLFHKLLVQVCEEDNVDGEGATAVRAELSGGHVCVDDFYASTYSFTVIDGQVLRWGLLHEVQGPMKDQTIETAFMKS